MKLHKNVKGGYTTSHCSKLTVFIVFMRNAIKGKLVFFFWKNMLRPDRWAPSWG